MVDDRYGNGERNGEREDELLSALIDGELAARERDALEARLAAEPALARRLEAMQRADQALRDSYGKVADEALPAELVALLDDSAAPGGGDPARDLPAQDHPAQDHLAPDHPAPGDPAAAVIPLRRPAAPPRLWVPSSIAAGIALAVGVALGISLGLPGRSTDADLLVASNLRITPDRELFGVLESAPSGETVILAGYGSATPRLTFRTDGGYCRELALSSGERHSAMVGCREDSGWRLAALIEVQAPELAGSGDGFTPASGPVSELDSVVDAMIAGAPLSAEDERRVIAAGWE